MASNKTCSSATSAMNQPKSNKVRQVRIPDGLKGRYQPPPGWTTLTESGLTAGTFQLLSESPSAKSTHKIPADSPAMVQPAKETPPAKNTKIVTIDSPIEAQSTPILLGEAGVNRPSLTRKIPLSRTQKIAPLIGSPRGLEHRWVAPRKKTKLSYRECQNATAASMTKGTSKEERGNIGNTEGLPPKVSHLIAKPTSRNPFARGYVSEGTPDQADHGPTAGFPPKVSPHAIARPVTPFSKNSETSK